MTVKKPAGTLLAVRAGGDSAVTLVIAGDTEEKLSLTVSRKTYEALFSPAVGTLLSEDTLATLAEAAKRRRAVGYALSLLARSDVNKKTLLRKLLQHGFDRTSSEDAVAEMERCGYIREEDAATRAAETLAGRGWSRRKVYGYLVSHGFPSDLVSRVLADCEARGTVDFEANKSRFIEQKRAAGLDRDAILRALYRAGF